MATWMLVFWACMLQPDPNETTYANTPTTLVALVPALAAGINLIIIICMFWDICVIQFNPSGTFLISDHILLLRKFLLP